MISAATGAVALVVAPVSHEYGVQYLVAAVILGGLLQVVFALIGVARLMRFLPRSVMVGFVNALAILIFAAEVPYLLGVPWLVYPLVAVGLAVMVALPLLTKVVPAPLAAIVALTAFTVSFGVLVPTVGDTHGARRPPVRRPVSAVHRASRAGPEADARPAPPGRAVCPDLAQISAQFRVK